MFQKIQREKNQRQGTRKGKVKSEKQPKKDAICIARADQRQKPFRKTRDSGGRGRSDRPAQSPGLDEGAPPAGGHGGTGRLCQLPERRAENNIRKGRTCLLSYSFSAPSSAYGHLCPEGCFLLQPCTPDTRLCHPRGCSCPSRGGGPPASGKGSSQICSPRCLPAPSGTRAL